MFKTLCKLVAVIMLTVAVLPAPQSIRAEEVTSQPTTEIPSEEQQPEEQQPEEQQPEEQQQSDSKPVFLQAQDKYAKMDHYLAKSQSQGVQAAAGFLKDYDPKVKAYAIEIFRLYAVREELQPLQTLIDVTADSALDEAAELALNTAALRTVSKHGKFLPLIKGMLAHKNPLVRNLGLGTLLEQWESTPDDKDLTALAIKQGVKKNKYVSKKKGDGERVLPGELAQLSLIAETKGEEAVITVTSLASGSEVAKDKVQKQKNHSFAYDWQTESDLQPGLYRVRMQYQQSQGEEDDEFTVFLAPPLETPQGVIVTDTDTYEPNNSTSAPYTVYAARTYSSYISTETDRPRLLQIH